LNRFRSVVSDCMENLIEINPKIMVGKPVIKGTRITVEHILEKIAAGQSCESIVSSHPHLSHEEVASAVRFALEQVKKEYPPYTDNQRLLESINEAYAESDPEDEQRLKTISSGSTWTSRVNLNRDLQDRSSSYRTTSSTKAG
jgi:uncharacterized protein (DUF433 family)